MVQLASIGTFVALSLFLGSPSTAKACAKSWSEKGKPQKVSAFKPKKSKKIIQHEANRALIEATRNPFVVNGQSVRLNPSWVLLEQSNSYRLALTPPANRNDETDILVPIDFHLANVLTEQILEHKLSRADRSSVESYGRLRIERSDLFDVYFGPEKDQLILTIDPEFYRKNPGQDVPVKKIRRSEYNVLSVQRDGLGRPIRPPFVFQPIGFQTFIHAFAELVKLEKQAGGVGQKRWNLAVHDLSLLANSKERKSNGAVEFLPSEVDLIRLQLSASLLRLDLLTRYQGNERTVPRVNIFSWPDSVDYIISLSHVRAGDPAEELKFMNRVISDNAPVFFGTEMDTAAQAMLPLGVQNPESKLEIPENLFVDVAQKEDQEILNALRLDRRNLDMIHKYLADPFFVKKMLRLNDGVFAANQYVGFFVEHHGQNFLILDTPVQGNAIYIFRLERNNQGTWFASYPSKKQVRLGVDAYIARIYHQSAGEHYERVFQRITNYDPSQF